MNSIKKIRLSKDYFIMDLDKTSLKLNYEKTLDKYVVDISEFNLINATKIAILCSTYCFIKDFKKTICWIVNDEETKRAISILRLKNVEEKIKGEGKDRVVLVS